MSWHRPEVLWGLLLLAVPIIIHLFHFRRARRVLFSNVALLEALRRQRHRFRRLRHLLALALRMLALAALIMAFAGPYMPGTLGDVAGGGRLTLFIDNSWSMSYSPQHIALFDRARAKALEILDALPPQTRVQILTHRFSAEEDLFVSPADARRRIQQLTLWPVQRTFSQIQRHISENIYGLTPQQVLFISDFQRTLLTDTIRWTIPATALMTQPPDSAANTWVDHAAIDVPLVLPMQQVKLKATLQGILYRPRDVDVTLKVGKYIHLTEQITLEQGRARKTVPFSLRVRADQPAHGWVAATPDALSVDDRYYFALPVVSRVRILYLYGDRPAPAVEAVFRDDSLFMLESVSARNWREDLLNGPALVIAEAAADIPPGIWNRLEAFVTAGGNVLLLGRGTTSQAVWTRWGLPHVVAWQKGNDMIVPTEHPFFGDVFRRRSGSVAWPEVSSRPVLKRRQGIALLEGRIYRTPYLLLHRKGQGHVFQLVPPLDSVPALVRHALWVPMLIKPALYGKAQPIAYELHPSAMLTIPYAGDRLPALKAVNVLIGEEKPLRGMLSPYGLRIPLLPLETPGVYRIAFADRPDSVRAVAAVNLERKESVLRYLSAEELAELGFRPLSGEESRWEGALTGRELWPWLLISALAFLLAEMFVLRNHTE